MNLVNLDLSNIDPSTSPRYLKMAYDTGLDLLIRVNPIRVFLYDWVDPLVKRSVFRKLHMTNDVIPSLGRSIEQYKGTRTCALRFLSYALTFDHVKKEFIDLYKLYNTWEIAEMLGVSQSTVRTILGPNGIGITSRSMRCSKIHLKMKPWIESCLGLKTETERYINGYWIDEFCEELGLCIEIDGSWCHDSEYDKIRDEVLKSKGYKVVRIEAYSDYDTVNQLLAPYGSLLRKLCNSTSQIRGTLPGNADDNPERSSGNENV